MTRTCVELSQATKARAHEILEHVHEMGVKLTLSQLVDDALYSWCDDVPGCYMQRAPKTAPPPQRGHMILRMGQMPEFVPDAEQPTPLGDSPQGGEGMIDLERAKALCADELSRYRKGEFDQWAEEHFVKSARTGWPASLEEIERLREALRVLKPCTICQSRVGSNNGGDCWADNTDCHTFKVWRAALGEEKA